MSELVVMPKNQIFYPTSSNNPVKITKELLFQSDTLQNEKGKPVITVQEAFGHFEYQLENTFKDIKWNLHSIEASNMSLTKPSNYIDRLDDAGNILAIPFEDANKTIQKFLVEYVSDQVFEDEVRLSAIQVVHYKPSKVEVQYAMGGNVRRCSNGMINGKYMKKMSSQDIDLASLDVFLRDWVYNHKKVIQDYTNFIHSQKSLYMNSQAINEYIGNMFRNILHKEGAICPISTFTDAVREVNNKESLFPMDDNGGMLKWDLYNAFTHSLKSSEIAERAKRHNSIMEYFSVV